MLQLWMRRKCVQDTNNTVTKHHLEDSVFIGMLCSTVWNLFCFQFSLGIQVRDFR